MFLVLSVFSLILWGIYIYFSNRELRDFACLLQGPLSLPIMGSAYLFLWKKGDYLLDMVELIKRYGSPMKFWLGLNLLVIFSDPKHAEKILTSTKITHKHEIYEFLKPLGGSGLIGSSGLKWKSARKLIQPLFNIQFVSQCICVFQVHVNKLNNILKEHIDGDVFNVEPIIHKCTMDIIGESILGTKIGIQDGKNADIVASFGRLYRILVHRIISPWLHFEFIYNLTKDKLCQEKDKMALESFFDGIVAKGKKLHIKNDKRLISEEFHGFIPALLPLTDKFYNNSENLDDIDFRGNLQTLFAASEDTVTAIAAAALVCFGMYPEIQEKAFKEIQQKVPDLNTKLSFENISQLQYMDMCVKDVLRLFPIAPVILRKTTEVFEIDNLRIPSGCGVLISIFNLHLNPAEWEVPMEFYPEHFLPDAVKNRNVFSFIPFSAGPRGCIGKTFAQTSIKLLLTEILRLFEVKSEGKYSDIYTTFKADVSVRPTGGYPIKLKRRIWN